MLTKSDIVLLGGSVKAVILSAEDLEIQYEYEGIGTPHRRIKRIVYISAKLGLKLIEDYTYAYDNAVGDYYITKVTTTVEKI